MARITFKGLKEYELKLAALKEVSRDIAGKAIAAGAAVIADQVKTNLNGLNTTDDGLALAAYSQKKPTYLTRRAKDGLIESFGITPMTTDNDGFYNVKLGFDGYNEIKTKKYPKGQPNQLLARACESGSTAMIKQPFMQKAVTSSRKKAESKMAEVLDEEIKKRMEH